MATMDGMNVWGEGFGWVFVGHSFGFGGGVWYSGRFYYCFNELSLI
jgi:hypothetical protein